MSKKYLPVRSGGSINISTQIQSAFEAAWLASCQALDESVHEIYLQSTETYCPVDTGLLKSTAKDELIVDTHDEHTREISYGSEEANYARIVHEIPYAHYNPPMAQWKYLEVPIRLNEQKLIQNVKNAAREAV